MEKGTVWLKHKAQLDPFIVPGLESSSLILGIVLWLMESGFLEFYKVEQSSKS